MNCLSLTNTPLFHGIREDEIMAEKKTANKKKAEVKEENVKETEVKKKGK